MGTVTHIHPGPYVEDTTPMRITRGQRDIIIRQIEAFEMKYKGSTKLLDDLHHLESLVYAFVRPVEKKDV